ncbi:IS701 family transposase [Thiolapillus brandeum]|uniref:IS701 family transposase n=1 Tax=Thiolapillus brandeum TaxID=1076588 RepID=UPI001CB7AA64|nr:IS701 family transposase [Thiolapillus brandeum]
MSSRTRNVCSAFQSYIRGLFQASRGSLLRMSEVVDTDSQALHHLLTEAGVDWDGLSGEVARQADALLGGDQAALILDESAFVKKGKASAGVARMWNGRLGKVDNSQVGVFSALCRNQRVTLLDSRLYLPKTWVEDAQRCRRAHIPEEARQLRSKCDLALELVDTARQHSVRFGYVAVDGGYGKDPVFLRRLAARSLCFVADVHKDQRIWLEDPAPCQPVTSGRGRPAKKRRTDRPSLTVAEWAARQPASAWKVVKLRQGEKGTLKAEYLHARVWVWDGKEETARHWHLLVRRECGAGTPSHYVLSNADADASTTRLARMQGCRFFIEHAFREAKSELAMADYQVRRWDAWHRHMALVRIAMLFLLKERLAIQDDVPMLSLADLVLAIDQLLPRPEPTPERIARIIQQRHRRRQKALESCLRRELEI